MTEASTVQPRPRPERFRQARAEEGLTQEELAQRARVSLAMVGKVERGDRSPRGPVLRRLAKALRKPVSFFFEEDAR